ncbi:MAG: right-handed parallel beta-helix repeat-containing protein [Proteobacteria bacterium]|nr:right-handed parallel beta-helix repeat-containing protein [Pseudomonadota bacterium]
MKRSLVCLSAGIILISSCKAKYLNLRSQVPGQNLENSADINRSTIGTLDTLNLPRPTVPDEAFIIPEVSDDAIPEGLGAKRSDGGYEVSGSVSGLWSKNYSPISVVGDLNLSSGKTLVIAAGVEVIFRGKYRLSIEGGSLKINGSASEKVHFSAENPELGWAGIRICPDANCQSEENQGRLEVRHAIFEYAQKDNMDPNDNTWRRGGVFYVRGTLTAMIEDSIFQKNYAQERGGAMEIIANNPNVIVRRNLFWDNRNESGGGALHITHGRTLTIEDNTFTGNQSKAEGGAIYLLDSAAIVFRNNRFRENTSGLQGGAIYCDGHADSIRIDASNAMLANHPSDSTCDP